MKRDYENLLLDAIAFARDNEVRGVRLLQIPTPLSFGLNNAQANRRSIYEVAEKWSTDGLGTLSYEGSGWPFFVLNDKAFRLARRIERRRRLRGMFSRAIFGNWSAISAISALVAAVAAIISAYFSYLSMKSH